MVCPWIPGFFPCPDLALLLSLGALGPGEGVGPTGFVSASFKFTNEFQLVETSQFHIAHSPSGSSASLCIYLTYINPLIID